MLLLELVPARQPAPAECPHAPPRQPRATVAASASRALTLNFPSFHCLRLVQQVQRCDPEGPLVEGGGWGVGAPLSEEARAQLLVAPWGRPLASPGGQFLAGCTS